MDLIKFYNLFAVWLPGNWKNSNLYSADDNFLLGFVLLSSESIVRLVFSILDPFALSFKQFPLFSSLSYINFV